MNSRRRSIDSRAMLLSALLCTLVFACGGRTLVVSDVRGADASQDGGDATPGRCFTGEQRCDGVCVDVQIDRDNCGTCGTACSGDHVCREGRCVDNCYPLYRCGEVCVDTQNDPHNCSDCGTACSAGSYCVDGICRTGSSTCACAAGRTCCPGSPDCIDLAIDVHNCGACGSRCDGVCMGGQCVVNCAAPTVACGGSCTDVRYDSNNCGGCGMHCSTGTVCIGGMCSGGACPPGTVDCGGSCVDVQTSPMHCGGCGMTCPAPSVCSAGICRPSTGAPPGSPCIDDASCAGASGTHGYCLSMEMGFPSGDCVLPCSADGDCLGGVCVQPPGSTGGTCFGRCGAGEFACRAGYICAHDGWASAAYCIPDCTTQPGFCGANRCDSTTGRCLGCMADGDCVGGGTCDTATAACRCSSMTTCAPGYTCNAASQRCGCANDAACGVGHRCDVSTGSCVLM